MQTTALLSIFRTADTYSFQFSAPGDHVRATKLFATLAQEQTTAKQLNHQLDSIARLLNQLQLPGVGAPPQRSITDHDALLALGRLLYSNLFPAAIQQALHLLPPETSLLLATDEPAIPWELAHDGTNYLGLTFNVGRQLLQPTLHPPPSQRHAPKWATLFIGNPTDDLPETMRELEAIVELVEALPGVAPPMVLVRDRATKERILHELASGAYDLIHYSGHAHVDAHNHAESGLLLADNQRLTANEIARNLAGSPFIFLNGCESSRAAPDQQRAATTLAEGMTQSITTAFLRGGAKGVIGTIWPIPDQGSHNFALSFYTHALRGETVGTALRLSRAKARTETLTSPLWATYTLYGNPTEQLFAPQRHEQRTVTVLALQLTGFAALHELASPGTAAIWEREFQEELQRLAQRYGGELLSITPSVLLLQFGVPIGLETSALHAAQMALALQRYLQNFHRQEIATLGTQMHYRAAITTGTVLAQWQNTGMPTAHYWVTSNVAEQSQGLVTQVEPNAIWLDSTTHALLQHFFVLQERGEIALPLRNRALSVYQLLDERPANELPVAAANFVGREQELAQLQQWWQEAKRGQGRVVGITGAPGIGKTELIHYFQQEAATTDCHQLRVTCHP
ncbi:MAG: CHAT domain-containing protein, partial [Caldilineaceae bacterium]|nr:CHAT domain-containing protein [Caldilineaceae bacterium]